MAFDSIADFFQMGTHGLYVWSTYAISLVALIGLAISSRLRQQQIKKQLQKRYQREQGR